MTRRGRVILNPAAGADRALTHLAEINERLRQRYGSMEIVLTTGDGDCETAARRAVEDGCTHLFIGGGDGTLNEALNGVATIDGALANTTFGVIPLGTGNDFVQALAIPGDLDEALATLLEDKVVDVDLGVGERPGIRERVRRVGQPADNRLHLRGDRLRHFRDEACSEVRRPSSNSIRCRRA